MIACQGFRLFAVFLHTVAFGSFRFWQPSRTRSLLAAAVFSQSSRTRWLLAASAPPWPTAPQPSCTQSLLAGLALRSFLAHDRTSVALALHYCLSAQSAYTRSLSAVFALCNPLAPSRFRQHLLLQSSHTRVLQQHSLFSHLFYSRPVQLLVAASLLAHSRFWQYSLSSSHRTVAPGSFHFSVSHDRSWKHLPLYSPLAVFSCMGASAALALLPHFLAVFRHKVACISLRFSQPFHFHSARLCFRSLLAYGRF